MLNKLKMKSVKVSLITVNYKGEKFLRNFFESIKKSRDSNLELIFVDNSSGDGSVALVRNNYPQVKIIENRENLGYVLGNNQAARIARGEYLFFVNDDMKIDHEAIGRLTTRMEKDPQIGIAGCQIRNYEGKKTLHTGIGIDPLGYPVISKKIFYVEGSALMIKKELFKKLGGFDEKYFMFHEDVDLAWRVWLLGYRVLAFPEARVDHAVGASAGGGPKIKNRYYSSYLRRYYSERNNIRTLLKNYRISSLLIILPLYFLINLLEILFYIFLLKFKIVYLYLKAYIWNLVNLPDSLKKRAEIQRRRKVSDGKIFSQMYWGIGKLVALKKAGIPKFK